MTTDARDKGDAKAHKKPSKASANPLSIPYRPPPTISKPKPQPMRVYNFPSKLLPHQRCELHSHLRAYIRRILDKHVLAQKSQAHRNQIENPNQKWWQYLRENRERYHHLLT